jgi:hypothetical protein
MRPGSVLYQQKKPGYRILNQVYPCRHLQATILPDLCFSYIACPKKLFTVIISVPSPTIAKIAQIQNALILLGTPSCAAAEIKHTPEASESGDEMSTPVFGDVGGVGGVGGAAGGVGGVDGITAALGLIIPDWTLSSPWSSTAVTA